MQRFLLGAVLLLTLCLQAGPALAACQTSTIWYNGKMVMCTTCCTGSFCHTTCF